MINNIELRDWYAGMTLIAQVLANYPDNLTEHDLPMLAKDCFRMADVMIKERSTFWLNSSDESVIVNERENKGE